jgi:NDP-hexose-3-ketoreductase
MNKKVRIGILGCANFAKRYAIPAFQSIDNAEVVAIASREYAKAKEWASLFAIRAEESYDSLIARDDIDAIHIPLPNSLHKEWIIKSARAGKHIICEKSIAPNFEDVKEIVEECKQNNVVLYENFMCGYHPQHARVLSMINEGVIGTMFTFRGCFGFPKMNEDNFRYSKELGGGVLNENGAYLSFMARKMFAKEPLSVTANLYTDVVDMKGTMTLDFGEGLSAFLAFSLDAVYQNNYSIWGSKGIINVNRAYSIPPDMKPDVECITNENLKETKTQIEIEPANHFTLIFSDFCHTILHKDTESFRGGTNFRKRK